MQLCVCTWTCMYVSFCNKNTYFCHILFLGAQLHSTLRGCNERPAYLKVDTTLEGPWERKGKDVAAWRRDCHRQGQIHSSTQRAHLSYKILSFLSDDQLGLGCGLWCIFLKWNFLHFILLCFIKMFTYFLYHDRLCASSQACPAYGAVTSLEVIRV